MSPSSATHDTLTRPPLWRGVARPHMLLMPIVLLALGVLFQTVDTSLAKCAFDVIINYTTASSALVAITVAAIGALTAIATGIAMRSQPRVAAAHNGALRIAIGVAMTLSATTSEPSPTIAYHLAHAPPHQRSSASPRG